MEYGKYIGKTVIHKYYGKGCMTDIVEGKVVILFDAEEKKFMFPSAFHNGQFLEFEDSKLQKDVEELYDREQNRADIERAEEKEKIRAEQEEKLKDTNIQRKNKGVRGKPTRKMLSYGDSFRTHVDAINSCFGFNHDGYRAPYKVIDDKYAAWFPSIAKIVNDEYVPSSTSKGWINVLSNGGTVLVECRQDKSENTEHVEKENLDRFVFAKFDSDYVFIGVFRYDKNSDYATKGHRYERIGNRVDLWTMEITNV